ncbi:Ig-like domain-containing protein [Granulosicoccus sp. 3-233]|uniref:Ig-like domain-containing protein n=1 Tax=Granulosicoccus sp. 3-233 TaxID=3417969 RepID=UPI003D335E13
MVATAVGLTLSAGVQASGPVSSIQTSEMPATPFVYTAEGVEYQWGMGNNQIMEGFTSDGLAYSYAASADHVAIQRRDIPGVTTGEPCGIFVERLSDGDASRQFAADYPSDGSGTGNCDIPAMLSSRVLNRGAVDLFSNVLPDAKNIERLDYVFDHGVLTPFSADAMERAGHLAAEKSSNNPVKMAAILSLDIFGQPASYGPMVLIGANGCSAPEHCYGITDLQHQYSFLQNNYNEPQSFPVETERSFESVGMAFISADSLGLQPGQRYFGFSFFADDVNAEDHDLLDPSTFPSDTEDDYGVPGDDADIYGGLSGYFLADSLNVTTGAVFNDVDGSGTREDTEAGISDIAITLYEDVNGNGIVDAGEDMPIGDSIDSDISGNFVLPGIPDGNYIVVMDESDPELPSDLIPAPGTNPHPLTISGGDSAPVYFPFIDPNGNGGGTTAGGTDGNTDSGSSDGGADGNTDSGNTDGGTDGNTDSGNTDGGTDGNTDSGNTDGGTDGNTDSGNTDGGADGNTDSGNSDGGTDGNTDSGNTDGGTDGNTDSGNTDGGADGNTDSGSTDGGTDGNTDSGNTDGGTDGNTDSGNTDGGVDGNTDSGSTDGGSPIDDPNTDAVDDEFTVNQGRSGTFDVLANDLDGVGTGLTLISVSESPNASIEIVDNQVEYRPDYGFYGTDTFLYEMEDADGTRSTGNVVVNVIRYSDLNGNMINDFVECGCDNLSLQTGIHGSGVGSLSLMGTWLLLMGVLIRRLGSRWVKKAEQEVVR